MPGSDKDPFGSVEDYLPDLSAIHSAVFSEINRIADSIDAVGDRISASLRSTIDDSPWLPASIRRPPPPSPKPSIITRPAGYIEVSRDWVSRHRAVTAAIFCFFGTGAFLIWRRHRMASRAKRRAKRAKNGQRTEVVVLAGPPAAPLTRSLSLDLERRGFIVYIMVNSLWEERLIQADGKADIHPLHLDVTSPSSIASAVQKFSALLESQTPHNQYNNVPKYPLRLCAFMILPQTPTPPPATLISDLSTESWSDTLTLHLLSPLTVIQAFLPLIKSFKSTLLFLTPIVTPVLAPPLHGAENVVAAAMKNYVSTLRKETLSEELRIVEFRLGAFDESVHRDALETAVILRRPEGSGSSSESSLTASEDAAKAPAVRGTPLRKLHLEVFDAIVGKRGGVIHVGRGSRMYDTIGALAPDSLIGWMLGFAARRESRWSALSNRIAGRRWGVGNLEKSTEWDTIESQLTEQRREN